MVHLFRKIPRSAVALVAAVVVASSQGEAFAGGGVGVLYPDLASPYSEAFESIVSGIASEMKSPVRRFPLGDRYSPKLLEEQLSAEQIDKLIVLGRRGVNAVPTGSWSRPMVVGGIVRDASVGSKYAGVTLDPDPRAVLVHLTALAPHVRHIYTVVNPEQSGWLIERARNTADQLGLAISVRDATTPRAAAAAFGEILEGLDPARDALWLQLDPIDEATLRSILTSAWAKRFVVFSNHPEHAQRGALYSVIPDYTKVGKRLGALIHRPIPGLQPNADLRLAVNLRTARHLGLSYGPKTLESIEAIYK